SQKIAINLHLVFLIDNPIVCLKTNWSLKMSNTDLLVKEVYATLRRDLISSVYVCASTVRVSRNEISGFIQKDADNPDSLWEAFNEKGYLVGMETIHDAFRAIILVEEIEKAGKA